MQPQHILDERRGRQEPRPLPPLALAVAAPHPIAITTTYGAMNS